MSDLGIIILSSQPETMVHKVEKFIKRHNLLQEGERVLVALSGGADSVALLLALRKLGYECIAVHCNFHLRGEESNRDETFVKRLCERLGIELHTVHFDTAAHAKENGISIEMAAREQRYNAFEEIRKRYNAAAIAVAHHRDDSAETLLLNLVRGTGIKGLRGIQPKNGHIVRPLLCVGREEILDYLKWRGEEYVTDSTNLTTDYTRNKIRLEIIPKLAEINPSVLDTLAATAQRITEAELIYSRAIEESIARVKKGNIIEIEALKREIAPATLLHEILSPLGFNTAQTRDILSAALEEVSGRQFHAGEYSVIKDRDRLVITGNIPHIEPIPLPAEGVVTTPLGTLEITAKVFDGTFSKERNVATLDAEKVAFPLTLRHAETGDRFAPFGMRGTKLVSDYLTDRKKSIVEKQQQLVVTDANGTIVWLAGERPSAKFCINESTRRCLILLWNKKCGVG